MGMAASQARYLSLTARMSNLEYQGQQINQERTVLSQQCTALYNSLLTIEVPTPPSTSDYTKVEYKGTQGATTFTVGNVKPQGEVYCVEIKTTKTGNSLQQDYGTKKVGNEGVIIYAGEIPTVDASGTGIRYSEDECSKMYVLENGIYRKLDIGTDVSVQSDGKYVVDKLNPGAILLERGAASSKQHEFKDPDSKSSTTIGGYEAFIFDNDLDKNPKFADYNLEDYREAIANTFGDKEPENFYVYIDSSGSVDELKFALFDDVESIDGFATTYSYIPNGTFIVSDQKEDCKLTFDAAGRINKLSIPVYQYDGNGDIALDADGNRIILAYTDTELEATTVTDEAAYNDAMAQYQFAQYEYDKAQQDINAKTELIQKEDKNLELKLTRLDNERKAIDTELQAVKKVIDDNIDKTFKTFNG